MPEWGMLPIPKKLVKAGVRDMLRIFRRPHERYELRRLHPACGARKLFGGPLAFVQTGDEIEVDAAGRKIHLHVSDEDLAARRAAW